MEDFFYAGGLRALLPSWLTLLAPRRADGHRQDRSARTSPSADGLQRRHHPPARTSRSDRERLAGGAQGQPRARRLRHQAARPPSRACYKHAGPALVFDGLRRDEGGDRRRDLDVTPDHVLVLQQCRAARRAGHAGMGHAADPEEAAEAGRARHAAHLRRAHERHQLRRLHPACRAREPISAARWRWCGPATSSRSMSTSAPRHAVELTPS